MKALFFLFYVGTLLANTTCPKDPQSNEDYMRVFERYEELEIPVLLATQIAGKLEVTIQELTGEGVIDSNNVPVPKETPVGWPLVYELDQIITSGFISLSETKVINAPLGINKSLTYPLDAYLEGLKGISETLRKKRIDPTQRITSIPIPPYISRQNFQISPLSPEDMKVGDKVIRVLPFNLIPKKSRFSGTIWLNMENCMPILLRGAVKVQTMTIDKVEIEYHQESFGFYPKTATIRSFVNPGIPQAMGRMLVSFVKNTPRSPKSTEVKMTVKHPRFTVVQPHLLQELNIPVPQTTTPVPTRIVRPITRK